MSLFSTPFLGPYYQFPEAFKMDQNGSKKEKSLRITFDIISVSVI